MAEHQLAFRIGINLGDVIVESDDIQGDGVNIADRLQGLAEPGGIVISGTAYDHVQDKLAVGFADLGEQQVKNIAKPVRVYRVLLDPAAAGKTIRGGKGLDRGTGQRLLRRYSGPRGWRAAWLRPWEPKIEAASVERMALPLPDKPSLVVLPFANMSDDPKQDYFADGMTDDLITELSKVSGLFVIARNSSFTYKGRPVKIAQVAEELGVRYVLEGSVQRAGDRVRINAQLIDALNGGHVWADRFDGSLADIFALQDEVTRSSANALAVRLTSPQEASLFKRKPAFPWPTMRSFAAGITTGEPPLRTMPKRFPISRKPSASIPNIPAPMRRLPWCMSEASGAAGAAAWGFQTLRRWSGPSSTSGKRRSNRARLRVRPPATTSSNEAYSRKPLSSSRRPLRSIPATRGATHFPPMP